MALPKNLAPNPALSQLLHSPAASSLPSPSLDSALHWESPGIPDWEGRGKGWQPGWETLMAFFPRDSCAAVVDDVSHLRKSLLMRLEGS